ncbi:MAG: YicC family protein, partial [Firmicutes bacterium]|nr:YicC family protein [Bacillota bacterium]
HCRNTRASWRSTTTKKSEVAAPAARRVRVDTDLLAAVRGALEEARWRLDSPHPVTLGDLLRVPGWLQVGEAEAPSDEEANWELVRPALEAALADAVSMREREGQALQADILSRTETVRELARQVRERAPTVVEEMARRLSRRVEELAGHAVDPQRIAAEVAIMAERADVSEEIARIGSHLDQLVALAEQGGLCGRKLDFLLQELQREWNTVGSKAGDARISQWVVEAKTELERIREQVQNIE